jgi:hypothetical protein
MVDFRRYGSILFHHNIAHGKLPGDQGRPGKSCKKFENGIGFFCYLQDETI